MKILVSFKHSLKDDIEWYWKVAGKLIKWWTKSDYFHVEVAVDDKWIAAHTETGIKVEPLQPLYDKRFDYYEIEVPDLSEPQIGQFWKFINAQVDTGYDWKGIYLTQIIKLDWENKNKWFCSEMVAKVLQMLYVDEFIGMKPNRASPQDIFEIISKKGRKVDPD